MRFKNKTVLVTGGGYNTGLGIAASFAAEGAIVFLNDKTPEDVHRGIVLLRKQGFKRIYAAPGDIGDSAAVESLFGLIRDRSRKLDILVNNAAHQGVGYVFQDTPIEFFESVVRVNLIGTFHVSLQAARLMTKSRGGVIINIGSNVSTRAIHNRSAYVASKGGLDALTLAMAVDLAPFHVRVNSVAPGYVHTDRWKSLAKKHIRRRRANVPLAREVTPGDIARAVLFLSSSDAANITGIRMVVDGGCAAQHLPVDIDI